MMMHRSKSKLITTLTHLLTWSVFALAIFLYRPILSASDIPNQFWIRQTVTLVLFVSAFYVNTAFLVPRFLLRNHFGIYLVTVVILLAAMVLIHERVDSVLESSQAFGPPAWAAVHRPPRLDQGIHIDLLIIVISLLVLGTGTSIKVVQKWQMDLRNREALEKEKVTSELAFLKAQVNPHFFFNTLNNIYALTEVDARLAGKAIHQLSRMMRYLLYDTGSPHTLLSQEIDFIGDYVNLMRLRVSDEVKIRMEVPANLKDLPVAPAIFLPFVENAFKHGVGPAGPSHIDIVLAQRGKQVDLTVKNSVVRDNSLSLDPDSGIGLVNTKRRLDLLYPGKYRLDIRELNADNEYTVHLVVDLS